MQGIEEATLIIQESSAELVPGLMRHRNEATVSIYFKWILAYFGADS